MRILRQRLVPWFSPSCGDGSERISNLLAALCGLVILLVMFYAIAVARGW
jgi:hypothetical protein